MVAKPTVIECKCGRRWLISQIVLHRPLSCEECLRYYFFERARDRKLRRAGEYDLHYIGRFKTKAEYEGRTLNLGHAVKDLPQFEA